MYVMATAVDPCPAWKMENGSSGAQPLGLQADDVRQIRTLSTLGLALTSIGSMVTSEVSDHPVNISEKNYRHFQCPVLHFLLFD